LRFTGAGTPVADPQAMRGSAALSGSQGSVLDPIVAIRRRITLDPGESATIHILSGARQTRGPSGLGGYSISGDLPIVLVQIGDPANIDLVRQLVQAHAYWRLKGLAVDLVIWNEDHAGYRQTPHEQIIGL